jgi:hypothetical protein
LDKNYEGKIFMLYSIKGNNSGIMNRILILVILASILFSLIISFSGSVINITNRYSLSSLLNDPTYIFITSSRYIYTLDNKVLRTAYYIVTVYVNEPLSYAGTCIRDYIVKPQVFYLRPGETVIINTRIFAKAWIPFREEIIRELKNNTVTVILPTITVNIIAITWNAETYIYTKVLDSKYAIYLKSKNSGMLLSMDEIYKVLLHDPLAVFHGLNILINTNNILFEYKDISRYIEEIIGNERNNTCAFPKPYSPYDQDIASHIPSNSRIGFVPGSIFDHNSIWYHLYISRNNPPSNWSNKIVVNNNKLNKEDIAHATWYQLAYYFSGFFYINLNSTGNNMEEAVEQLISYAEEYIPSPRPHIIGYGDLLSELYAKYKHSYGLNPYHGIDWRNTWHSSREWDIWEPITAIHFINNNKYPPYTPSAIIVFNEITYTTFITNHVFAGQPLSTDTEYDSYISKLIIDKHIYMGNSRNNESLIAMIWKTHYVYGYDSAIVYYDFIIRSWNNVRYLLLIPYIVFYPTVSITYNVSSIREAAAYNEALVREYMKLYVEPYIWNHEDLVLMKSKILRKGHYTIDISRIFVYVYNKRYILINAPRKDIFLKTLTNIVDPMNNGWLSKYFMILANLFSVEKYGLAYDNDFLAIGWSIIGEKRIYWLYYMCLEP